MKKTICILSLFLLMQMSVLGADGDVFTSTLENGVVMTFKVVSETEKTCMVSYFYDGVSLFSAIDDKTTGNILIPSNVNGYKVVGISCSAFSGCNLDSIAIPEGVTSIGDSAFYSCKNLKELTIPEGVTSIGRSTFYGCRSLATINIPEGVTSIGSLAFCGCTGLTSITIPNSVKSIGNSAFFNCSSLSSINIPEGVTSIGNLTFAYCNSLVSINIPEGVTSIGKSTFAYCNSLVSINIPEGVTSIGDYAFSECYSLVSINIPEGVTSIGNNAFLECYSLASINIPESVTSIGDYAFYNCRSLTSINLPEGVTSIGERSFYGCNGLKYIVLPSTIQSVGLGAFVNCEMFFVVSKMINPPSVSLFYQPNVRYSTLYVPKGTKNSYSKNENWNIFGEIIEMDDNGIDNLSCSQPSAVYNGKNLILTSNLGATIYYTIDGTKPATSSELYVSPIPIYGMYIIKAIAVMDDLLDSKVLEYPIPYYYDNEAIHIGVPGKLGEALESYQLKGNDRLIVCGRLNAEDVNAIRQMPALRELDLQDLSFETGSIPDEFFSDMNMVVCRIQPASDVKSIGKRLFKDSKRLATIIWNGRIPTSGVLAEIGNPNLLLYVTKADDAPYAATDGVANIVVNGYASTVTLVDNAVGNANFYCPEPFTAGRIQYTHKYEMTTGYESCRGWETLALPFDVQSVEHESKGLLTPMIVNDQDKAPFWLYELTESGFVAADRIKANQPYIISMPNNMAYSNEYNLKGNVTFSAKDVSVSSTELINSKEGNKLFVPCFEGKQQSPEIYVLNVNEAYGGYLEGSVFVQNQFQTKPFGAYMTVEGGNAPALIPLFDKAELTGIKDINSNTIQGSGSKYSPVYNLSGQKQTAPKKGVNILGGKKLLVR